MHNAEAAAATAASGYVSASSSRADTIITGKKRSQSFSPEAAVSGDVPFGEEGDGAAKRGLLAGNGGGKAAHASGHEEQHWQPKHERVQSTLKQSSPLKSSRSRKLTNSMRVAPTVAMMPALHHPAAAVAPAVQPISVPYHPLHYLHSAALLGHHAGTPPPAQALPSPPALCMPLQAPADVAAAWANVASAAAAARAVHSWSGADSSSTASTSPIPTSVLEAFGAAQHQQQQQRQRRSSHPLPHQPRRYGGALAALAAVSAPPPSAAAATTATVAAPSLAVTAPSLAAAAAAAAYQPPLHLSQSAASLTALLQGKVCDDGSGSQAGDLGFGSDWGQSDGGLSDVGGSACGGGSVGSKRGGGAPSGGRSARARARTATRGSSGAEAEAALRTGTTSRSQARPRRATRAGPAKIAEQIESLRAALTEGGVATHVSRQALLSDVVDYIRALQAHTAALERDRQAWLAANPPPTHARPAPLLLLLLLVVLLLLLLRRRTARSGGLWHVARDGAAADSRCAAAAKRHYAPPPHLSWCARMAAPAMTAAPPPPPGSVSGSTTSSGSSSSNGRTTGGSSSSGGEGSRGDHRGSSSGGSGSGDGAKSKRIGVSMAVASALVFRQIFVQAAVAVAVSDLCGRFLESNALFAAATGYARDDLHRQTLFALAAPHELKRVSDFMTLASDGGGGCSGAVVTIEGRAGVRVPVTLLVITGKCGRAVSVQCVIAADAAAAAAAAQQQQRSTSVAAAAAAAAAAPTSVLAGGANFVHSSAAPPATSSAWHPMTQLRQMQCSGAHLPPHAAAGSAALHQSDGAQTQGTVIAEAYGQVHGLKARDALEVLRRRDRKAMGRRSGKASGGSEGKLQDATNTAPPSTSSNNNDSTTSSSSRLSNAKKNLLGRILRFKKRIRHRTALFMLFGIVIFTSPHAAAAANNAFAVVRFCAHRTRRANGRVGTSAARAPMELVLVAAFLLAFRAGEVVTASSFHGSCMDSVGSVHLSVIKKVDQLLQSLENVAYNRGVQRLAQGTAAAGDPAKILSLMQYVQGMYEVEFVTLLAANATILVSVNNASRAGEAFNPGGVVELASSQLGVARCGEQWFSRRRRERGDAGSTARCVRGGGASAATRGGAADGGRSLWMPGVLTYDELLLESPPLYRDRENNLDMAFKARALRDRCPDLSTDHMSTDGGTANADCRLRCRAGPHATAAGRKVRCSLLSPLLPPLPPPPLPLPPPMQGGHPYETHADAYIRWIVVPIYPINETSWSPPTDGTPPIGYVIGGDLGTGKSALTSLVSETLSGFGGVYMEPLNNEATKGDKKWLTAKYMAAHADVPVLVEGFSPLEAMADKQNKWLDTVVDEKGFWRQDPHHRPFAVAGRVWEHDAVSHEMAPIDGGAPVRLALVRGVPLDPVARAARLIASVVGLFGIFLLDALAL
ncbi:hypothetical protein JKP88DRAFT_310482 [Tribonema minus]|uniref:BHLH domain-containing protein n=1 Tax=Tribonema minus TaxID=303371 RepID=A0A836CI20_9STRA|nr:hypothetical protein JKP88DRAFT_310482 [Tribonema minus]